MAALPQPIPDPARGAHGSLPCAAALGVAHGVLERLRERLRAELIGRDELIELVLIALLADGHVLLEDRPGSGKTTLARALGAALAQEGTGLPTFRRIQFTPDLLPSDVTGASVFESATGRFRFERGPVFAHVLLADELNRTPPKVQAALLEAMAEKQVTCDGVTFALDALFCVIATQNALDSIGTYPLPLPQLDRFLFRIRMRELERQAELEVLASRAARPEPANLPPPVSRTELLGARAAIAGGVRLAAEIRECLVDASRALRADERVELGNSTRSLVQLLPALQTHALARGRDFVSSEDVEALWPHALGHRIVLAPGAGDERDVIAAALEAPLERLARSSLRRTR
jgi:MoxR-like ATPase